MSFKNVSSIPFIGSKWKYRKVITEKVLNNVKKEALNDKYLIIDLFGGSGSLTIIFKQLFNKSVFVLNDYDEILTDKQGHNKIDDTINLYNEIINKIRLQLKEHKTKEKFNDSLSAKIWEILEDYKIKIENNIQLKRLLSSKFSFNSRMLNFERHNDLYNRITNKNMDLYFHNFKDVEILHCDFEDVIKQIPDLKIKYNIKEDENIILLLDPPYLNFDMRTSYKINHWTFIKYLNIIKLFMTNYNIIMFEDSKCSVDDLIKFVNDLKETNIKIVKEIISKEQRTNKVKDIMILKKSDLIIE